MLGLDAAGTNSAQEASSDEESNDFSDDFLAHKLSTSETIAQHKVFHIYKVSEEVYEQDKVID